MKLTVEEVLARHNVERDRSGYIRCPAHDDHKPSCKVSEEFVYCFTCQWNADAAGLEAQLTGRSVGEVLKDWDDGSGPRPTIKKKSARKIKHERWVRFVVDTQALIVDVEFHIANWKMSLPDQRDFYHTAIDQINGTLQRAAKGRYNEEITPYEYDKLIDSALRHVVAWHDRWMGQ